MSMRILTLFFVCIITASPLAAQVSGFGSLASGYQRNPLFNFEKIADQIQQGYAEVGFESDYDYSVLDLRYIGGLTLFNTLSDRNYYEHSLRAVYDLRLHDEDDTTEVDPADSTDNFFHILVSVGARHDKKVFREFDNNGISCQLAYRLLLADDYFARWMITTGVRSYSFERAITNYTAAAGVEIGTQYKGSVQFGVILTGGLMHYPKAAYDTARFEESPTSSLQITRINPGSGQGGTTFDTTVIPSEKILLPRPTSNSSYQLTADIYGTLSWEGGSARIDALYRRNFDYGIHFLVYNLSTTRLNEDIYNDSYSYGGPDVSVSIQQRLPFAIQSAWSVEVGMHSFAVPGMDLEGNTIAPTRKDLNSGFELFLSRSLPLFGYSGIEISLDAAYVRNQSNDVYNDCSNWSVMGGVGVSF